MDHADAPTLPVSRDAAAGAPGRFGPYRILRRLGEGGFGEVWLAEHPALGAVALKILKGGGAAEVRQFVREGRLVLVHPGIPRIVDHGEAEGRHYLAQDYVEGQDLRALMGAAGPLPEARVLGIALQVCDVLSAAHARGIVHRDLKPGNVLVGEGDRVFVLDFGISRLPGLPEAADPRRALGTPAFMAPEQAAGSQVGPAADLYSLGVLVYVLLSGRLPITAESPAALLGAVRSEAPVPIERVQPGVSPGVAELLARLLAKDPAARPASAMEVARALRVVLDGLPAAGRFAELGRALSGVGSMVLVTGAERVETLERLAATASGLGFRVVEARARVDGGAGHVFADILGSPLDGDASTRIAQLEQWRRGLLDLARDGPVLVAIHDVHRADDATLDGLHHVSRSLASMPVVVVLLAPSLSGDVASLAEELSAWGLLARQVHGEPDPGAEEAPPPLETDEALRQARRAMARWSPRLAARRYEELLGGSGIEDDVRLEALVRLGALGRSRERRAEAVRHLERAAREAVACGARGWRARALREIAVCRLEEGDLPGAGEALAEARTLAAAVADRELLGQCANTAGALARARGEPAAAMAAFREAIDIAGADGDPAARASGLSNLAVVLVEQGHLLEARQHLEASLALRKAAGDPAGEGATQVNLGNLLFETGDHAGARRCYEEALRGPGILAEPRLLALATVNLAGLMRSDGEMEEALHLEQRALGMVRRLRDPRFLATSLEHLGALRADLGDLDGGRLDLGEALAVCRASGERQGEAECLIQLGDLEHRAGRCAAARALLAAGRSLAEELGNAVLACQARFLDAACRAVAGDPAAVEDLERVVRDADALAAGDLRVVARVELAGCLARDARLADARTRSQQALDIARGSGTRRLAVEALRLWESLHPESREGSGPSDGRSTT